MPIELKLLLTFDSKLDDDEINDSDCDSDSNALFLFLSNWCIIFRNRIIKFCPRQIH